MIRIPDAETCRELLIDDELRAYLSRICEWLASQEGELEPDQATYLDGSAVKVANVQSLLKRINLGKGRKFSEPHIHLADIWSAEDHADVVMIAVFETYGVCPSVFEPYREQWVEDLSAVLGLDEDLTESLPRERRVASQSMERAEQLMDEGGTVASIGRSLKISATVVRRYLDASHQSGAYVPLSRWGDFPQLLTVKVDGVTLENVLRGQLGPSRYAAAILDFVQTMKDEGENVERSGELDAARDHLHELAAVRDREVVAAGGYSTITDDELKAVDDRIGYAKAKVEFLKGANNE